MKRIIVNADDFGINEVVTSEIERMILAGAVSSTTVMANGTCLDEVRNFAGGHPEASYGVHLCLSEFDSITKSEGLHRAGITDDKGRFIHNAIFSLGSLKGADVQKAIEEELNAQIDIVSSLGFPISHADSHHHVHTIYPLKEVFSKVLNERGINKLRIGADFRTLRMQRHLILWMKRKLLNKYYRSQFITTDSFYSYLEYMKRGEGRDNGIVELMCHPGHIGSKYIKEMALVETKAAFKNNMELISYNDLH